MSYIAFELDAHNKAASIATAAGIDRRWVVAGLVDMWAHCFREKSDIITSIHIIGFFGADAGPALEAFGFLERVDRGWRVRGCSRYLRLSETRREAGKKGRAAQLATAGNAGARANAGQTPGKTGKTHHFSEQVPSSSPASAEQTPGKNGKTTVLPGQKRALSPNTESSTLRVEEDSVEVSRSARAPSEPAPDGGRAEGDHAAMVEPKAARPSATPPTPPKPDRPTAVYGTQEWRDAVALDNWPLLAWACYPGETEAERKARARPNAEAMEREERAQRAAEEAAWYAEQERKAAAMAQAAGGAP